MIIYMPTSYIWIDVDFKRALEYDDGESFKLLRLIQESQQSTWDHQILCANRISNDGQLLIKQLFEKPNIRPRRAVDIQN
jgi:hypothetical protein